MASSYNQKSSSSASRQPKPTYRKGKRQAPAKRAPKAPVPAPKTGAAPSQRRGFFSHAPLSGAAQGGQKVSAQGSRAARGQRKQMGTPRPQQSPRAAAPASAASLAKRPAQPAPRLRKAPAVSPQGTQRPPVGVSVPRSRPSEGVGTAQHLSGAQQKARPGASQNLAKRLAKRRAEVSASAIAALKKPRRTVAGASAGARTPGRAARIVGMVIGVLLALIVVGGVGYTFVANAGFFAVTDVRFEATEHVSEDVLEKLVSLPQGATLLNVDTDALADELRENPWVQSVSVKREFPHTLVITPVERKVFALVYISTGDISWAVDPHDSWIAPISLGAAGQDEGQGDASADAGNADGAADAPQDEGATDSAEGSTGDDTAAADDAGAADGTEGASDDGAASGASLSSPGYDAASALAKHLDAVLITDVGTDIDPKSGSGVSDEGVSTALSYAHGFSADFLSQVRSISAASPEACALYLSNGVEVSLGEAGNVRDKETVIEAVLSQRSGVTYLNVRDPENPTWREASIP